MLPPAKPPTTATRTGIGNDRTGQENPAAILRCYLVRRPTSANSGSAASSQSAAPPFHRHGPRRPASGRRGPVGSYLIGKPLMLRAISNRSPALCEARAWSVAAGAGSGQRPQPVGQRPSFLTTSGL